MITLRQDIFSKDALKIADWLDDHEIIEHLNEHGETGNHIRALVKKTTLPVFNQVFNQRGAFYLICLKEESIGYVKFIPKKSGHEIVITIGKKELWGKGYGRKALKKALNEAFFILRYKKIDAKIKAQNIRSLCLFEHIGFDGTKVREDLHHLSMDIDTYLKKAA
ncbi:GNAT family N-acetyltransferase [Proteiniclasticum sp.]|uniref:GNAT family N-acetyltransferase n=1 Tax=Proteiniclasticum sp. TaxID=2053595 RepID=UPI00289885D0|nr:GNAT family N-acetyltransferase [Proteiniclasticum sp.]